MGSCAAEAAEAAAAAAAAPPGAPLITGLRQRLLAYLFLALRDPAAAAALLLEAGGAAEAGPGPPVRAAMGGGGGAGGGALPPEVLPSRGSPGLACLSTSSRDFAGCSPHLCKGRGVPTATRRLCFCLN